MQQQQQQYPNPHQLAAAAAAAAGLQRLPYTTPGGIPGAPNNAMVGRMALMQNSLNSPCGEPGSGHVRQEHVTESANDDDVSDVESDMGSENDDEGSNVNSKVLAASCKEMLERLNQHGGTNTDDDEEAVEKVDTDELGKESLQAAAAEEARDLSQRYDSRCSNSSDTEFERSTGGVGGVGGGSEGGERATERPAQTEIKTQRPLGLLAQHGLTAKLQGAASKSHNTGSLLPITDQLHSHTRHRKREADEQLHHHQLDNGKLVDRGGGSAWKSEVNGGLEKERLQSELDFGSHLLLMDRRFMPSPPPSASPLTPDLNKSMSTPSGHHWTFEEQFKQLYEMSLEPKRKEFLDDLFSFMQKRGTPVNRIPIMAKQTLDLYELFRLVVSKGGLVEVINKKLWREITKGLNLPSSITSAAFTLRTQYMKYLYPYECDKLKLSTLAELQSAIDGNRREGRRPGYGYDFSPLPAMLPNPGPHLNVPLHPMNSGRPSPKDDDLSLLTPSHNHLRSLAEHDAQAMEAAARAMEEVSKRIEASRVGGASSVMTSMSNLSSVMNVSTKFDESPPCKRPAMLEDERFLAHMGMHSTHIKMTNQSNGRLEYESPMVVNMEINGMMYQGVLFAQHPRRI